MRTLDLDKLKEGLPGISPVYTTFIAEAAVVCLVRMGHVPGVRLKVEGGFAEEFVVVWNQSIGQDAKTTWGTRGKRRNLERLLLPYS